VSTGIGISQVNKVHNHEQLANVIEELSKRYPTQTILVEKFLGGREFTVGIIGTGTAAYVIGVRELVFLKGNPQYPIKLDCPYDTRDPALLELDVYGHDLKHKWSPNPQSIDMDLSDDIAHAAGEVALKAWKLLGCRDGGRVDIRHDKIGVGAVPNFIEVRLMESNIATI
jgi:D-alanine-D-alanine ligase-like ATP-grasp enzyme